ncbi:hypothetical protein Dda_4816 [Drechslerella dactyloides]|uniref:Uncharacterized protein n=1 Tax=Drechslerella dactyloides TaxID=74499 RepID=A0AAD6NJQ5_DREDA|nr:hypothetical protein Dda_4816 [Drechslerella dactyloides]
MATKADLKTGAEIAGRAKSHSNPELRMQPVKVSETKRRSKLRSQTIPQSDAACGKDIAGDAIITLSKRKFGEGGIYKKSEDIECVSARRVREMSIAMGTRRPAYAVDWDAMDNAPGGGAAATNQYISTKQQECIDDCRCATQKTAIGPEGEANKLLCPTFAQANFCERIVATRLMLMDVTIYMSSVITGCYCYIQWKPKKKEVEGESQPSEDGFSKLLDGFTPGKQRTELNPAEQARWEKGNIYGSGGYSGGYQYAHDRVQVFGANEPYYVEGPDKFFGASNWDWLGGLRSSLLGAGKIISGISKRDNADTDDASYVSAAQDDRNSCEGSQVAKETRADS